MAHALGSLPDSPDAPASRGPRQQSKKKGCKKQKCSKWKGGKCCCGRE